MENLDNQQTKATNSYNAPVNPSINQATPSGLQDRMSQDRHRVHHSKSRLGIIIPAVIFFVIIGVGAWWYYAQGQVWWMLRQAEWNWGSPNFANYQQDSNLDISIRNRSDISENFYVSFFGGETFNLKIASTQKTIGLNGEADADLNIKTKDVDLSFALQTKKIGDKVFFSLDAGNLGESVLGSFLGTSFFDSLNKQWFEVNLEESYNVSVNQEKLSLINAQFNIYLQNLKKDKVFDFEDLGNNAEGYRQIKLSVKDDKVEDFAKQSINYFADTYDILWEDSEVAEFYQDFRSNGLEKLENMKKEKPEDWQSFKDIFKSISFIISINPDSNIIHGLELSANNLELKANTYSTIINGSLKYFVKEIDYYEIERPSDAKGIEDLYELQNNASVSQDYLLENNNADTDGDGVIDSLELYFNTDPNNADTDGDGYTDGEEIANGYNPTGEGLMDPELIEVLQSERDAAQTSSVEAYLNQMMVESILCHDQGQDLQYSINYVCDGSQAPILGNFVCPSSSSLWPDIGYYGFTYTTCNSDVENGTFEYGASNGDITILCKEDGCVTQ